MTRMFLKNMTFQFPSSSFLKVIFECVEASWSFKFFGNFNLQRKTNER